MRKKKTTKAKIRNLVRIIIILFLSMLVTIFFCKKEHAVNDKILENTVNDAFVFQSMMLAHSLDPTKSNTYTDIETLEDDSDSFVSDAAIKTGKSQYYIRVNYGANCVNIYSKDDEGNYTVPYKAMICSTGKSTPKSGTYKITYKYRWLRLFGDVYGQYSTRIVKNILFHSVPYFKQRADTLEYEEYDKLGTTASAGCIRLTVQDAKWIYDNITSGTYVEFYSDKDNPGPLGKPKAQKISNNEDCRDWDPTDPDKNNPWNGGSGIPSVTYTYSTNNNNNSNKKTNTNTTNTTTNTPNNTINNNSNKISTNTIVDKENNKKPIKNEIVKNEISNNTTSNSNTSTTNTVTNTTTEKPNDNANSNTSTKPDSKPNTNTTVNNSDKEDAATKPTEPPSKEPEKNNSSTTNTTKPSEDTTVQTQKPESSSQESTETSITNNI